MEIKVLGSGCPRCEETEKNVKEALSMMNMDAKVIKVKDPVEIAKHGVFGTPAVVINKKVKSVGKIPSVAEITEWLKE